MTALNTAARKYTADRIVSVSGAPYDGYAFPDMLASLGRIGATHVEPAFIVGYTEPFDESTFSQANATQYARWLADAGIGCFAFSSHIDLGREDAVTVFRARMDFARSVGARVINTNASARVTGPRFFENISVLARHAEALDMWIGLENPGDGSDNLLNVAADAQGLLERIGSDRVGLNYDAGNTVSHRPAVDATRDALAAMPHCVHTHIKDVRVQDDGYWFCDLGTGSVDCSRILREVARTPLCLTVEMPLRLHRMSNAQPSRDAARVPVEQIESKLRIALDFVATHLR